MAIFDGGRIEEYIRSRTLTNDDLRCAAIRGDIARKLARVHSISTLPIEKSPINAIYEVKKLLKKFQDGRGLDKLRAFAGRRNLNGFSPVLGSIIAFNFAEAADWLARYEGVVNGQTVLCIWDMNRCNCLIREGHVDSFGERATLIDYEASGEQKFNITEFTDLVVICVIN